MARSGIHSDENLTTPAIEAVNKLAAQILGVELMLVYPTTTGWAERRLTGCAPQAARFCQTVQRCREGARHCRMCHILMTVAADSLGVCEQRCHAGARVLVAPVRPASGEALAVLSSCIFGGADAAAEVRKRARKLGLDPKELETAFAELQQLPGEKMDVARQLMALAGEILHEALARTRLEQKLHARLRHQDVPSTAVRAFRQAVDELKIGSPRNASDAARRKPGAPHTVRLVARLIDERPYLPFSVNELAAACRLTRNHFSTLFHQHVGTTFSVYLAERRLELAMELLRDPTLDISEVARRCGYDDPGYFARRFRRATGRSPRAWRRECVVSPSDAKPSGPSA